MFSENCGADQLQTDRQALGEAARNREARQPGHVRRDRQHVREVHGQRVLRLLADLEGDGRRRRADENVEALERGSELTRDHRSHLLRLAVVRVVVPGGERVGPEHDPALRLVAEAGVTRARDHLVVVLRRNAQAVAHAVVAREVRRRLRRRDQVVARQPVLDGARQLALADVCAQARRRDRSRGAPPHATPGSIPRPRSAPSGRRRAGPSRSSASGSSTGGTSTVVESHSSRPLMIP